MSAVGEKNVVFYTVNDDYIEYLRKMDTRVLFNKPENNTRPYAGFLVTSNDYNYLVPLSSQIKKSNHVTAVIPNRLTEVQRQKNLITKQFPEMIATIKFNNMIPVRDDVINKIDLSKYKGNKNDEDYLALLVKERLKTMKIFNEKKPFMKSVVDSCCNFTELEKACSEYKKD